MTDDVHPELFRAAEVIAEAIMGARAYRASLDCVDPPPVAVVNGYTTKSSNSAQQVWAAQSIRQIRGGKGETA